MAGLLGNPPAYNTFADQTNKFAGATTKFTGQPATIQPTVQKAILNQQAPVNPFAAGGPRGGVGNVLAEQERQRYKDFHDWYFRMEAARQERQQEADNYSWDDSGNFGAPGPFYYNYDEAPDWLVGRGVELPKDSKFQFTTTSGLTTVNPVQKWNEFRAKWKENPEYDKYTGVYHSDYYPKEWIQMARYWDYVANNR